MRIRFRHVRGIIFILCIGVLVAPVVHDDVSLARENDEQHAADAQIVFVGDVMLARAVERNMRAHGASYPFSHMQSVFDAAAVVANFEAAIPKHHQPTRDFAMRFSVAETYMPAVYEAGITHVSLANNHAYDFGASGLLHTQSTLDDSGIHHFGDPYTLSTSSIAYIETEHATVAVVGVYAVDRTPTAQELETVFAEAEKESDLQVAYVHWGIEYELRHSSAQEQLARSFIRHGVDAIIGHHPHVVQDIAVYDNVPVFYSLGNFIFDQYFSTDVQRGLVLAVSVDRAKALSFTLIPVSSEQSRNAPYVMEEAEKTEFLEKLAAQSDETLRDMIRSSIVAIRQ